MAKLSDSRVGDRFTGRRLRDMQVGQKRYAPSAALDVDLGNNAYLPPDEVVYAGWAGHFLSLEIKRKEDGYHVPHPAPG